MDTSSDTVESFAVLLSQGLASNDNEKIDAVLSKGDLKVVKSTLDELNANQIIPLIKAIDYRCRNRKRLRLSFRDNIVPCPRLLAPIFEFPSKLHIFELCHHHICQKSSQR